jgi:hypothetical protein
MGNVTTFTLDEQSRDAIEELRRTIGATSQAEVMRRALRLLREAARTSAAGGKILLRGPDKSEREVLLG